jgi:hypothetical protein
VNFFGHVAIARHVDDDPAFLLGAMAPDLLSMCGASSGRPTSAGVAAGQAHHLAVDAAFHASPAFVGLQLWAVRALVAAGLRRGPARGVAHVSIELLLDGVLASDGGAQAAYRRGLGAAEPFEWPDQVAAGRWRAMIRRLREGTIPNAYRDATFVAERVTAILARRPRLALSPDETAATGAFMPGLQHRVAADAPGLATCFAG